MSEMLAFEEIARKFAEFIETYFYGTLLYLRLIKLLRRMEYELRFKAVWEFGLIVRFFELS